MTVVVLHIWRRSGAHEVHELPVAGDDVVVPRGLLAEEDVVAYDVETAGTDPLAPREARERIG